ncbi:MAG TPA: hypothetical protein ENN18_05495 [Proteobacteria bacterium]|nr:hypothetical protein [Pseudomonadota bacterium]
MITQNVPKNLPRIKVGLALSDAGFYHRETMRLPEDLSEFFQRYQDKFETEKLFFELQPEMPWLKKKGDFSYVADEDNRWLKLGRAAEQGATGEPYASIIEAMRRPGHIFGVHQSIRDMDILSEDIHKKLETIESTQQGMLFAHLISADYFVFHLAQSKDYWDWNRSEQIAVALKAFQGWADFYKQSGFSFIPIIENLEFPKFPATPEEMVSIFKTCREFLPNLKICFDVSHFWRSRALILENKVRFEHLIPNFRILEASCSDYLDYAIEHIFTAEAGLSDGDIFLYHLGGCWKHLTHEIPGLRPGESPFLHKLRLDEPVYAYHPQVEMNLPKVINRLLRYNIERRQDVLIMLEIYQRNYIEMLEAARLIYDDIVKKARRIAEDTRRYAYLWEDK